MNLFLQTVLTLAVMGAILFGAAGDSGWPQGWAFLAIFLLGSAGFGVWLGRRDPGLLAARLGAPIQRGQPLWDRLFLMMIIPAWCGWLGLMGLDAQRWHASHMPVWLNFLGGALVIGGFVAVLIVFRENSFAAPVVRVQTERAQRVIETGPYAIVRHPMYAGALLYLLGMPLLLGSWYGLMALPLLVLALGPRAVMEERMLRRDLPGYADYMTRVRYRLIPYIW